jgi:hypothetical protein
MSTPPDIPRILTPLSGSTSDVPSGEPANDVEASSSSDQHSKPSYAGRVYEQLDERAKAEKLRADRLEEELLQLRKQLRRDKVDLGAYREPPGHYRDDESDFAYETVNKGKGKRLDEPSSTEPLPQPRPMPPQAQPSVRDDFGDSRPPKNAYWFKIKPNDSNAPRFKGYNISKFLDDFDFMASGAGYDGATKKRVLPHFCETEQRQYILAMPGYEDRSVSWETFTEHLLTEFSATDTNLQKTSRAYLDAWLDAVSRDPPPLNEYFHKFTTYYAGAIKRRQVNELEKGWLFFKGLPLDDRSLVMLSMNEAHRPQGTDINTYHVDKMYQYLRGVREQQEAMHSFMPVAVRNADLLAQRDAATLSKPLDSLMPKKYRSESALRDQAYTQNRPSPQLAPEAVVQDLVDKMNGLTLTLQEFEDWQRDSARVNYLFSKPQNYNYAYSKLVAPTMAYVERNDGSFKSSYYPITNSNADVTQVNGVERKPACRVCGQISHRIQDCVLRRGLIANGWYHEIKQDGTPWFTYHYGPKELRMERFLSRPPRANGDDFYRWLRREIGQYFNVTDDKLDQPFSSIPGLEGRKVVNQASGNVNFGYVSNDPEPLDMALERQWAARAAQFYDSVRESESAFGDVMMIADQVNGIETRGSARRGVDKTADGRVGKPKSKAVAKDLRSLTTPENLERIDPAQASIQPSGNPRLPPSGERPRQHPPQVAQRSNIGDFQASVEDVDMDLSGIIDDQPLLPTDRTPRSTSETLNTSSGTAPASEASSQAKKKTSKVTTGPPPSESELVQMLNVPGLNSILAASLGQEVRGLTVASLLSQDTIVEAMSKLLQEARKEKRKVSPEDTSGEVFVISVLSRSKANRTWELPEEPAVFKGQFIQAINPTLFGKMAEVNETAHHRQRYDIGEAQDGYDIALDSITTGDRTRIEKKMGVTTLKSAIPTCFISVMGSHCEALLDTGSELNVMRYTTARALNVHIQEQDQSHLPEGDRAGMIGASGALDEYVGTAYSVPVKIGTIVIPTHFKITRRIRRPVLLGAPFCVAARLSLQFSPMGRCYCKVSSADGQRTISFLGIDPSPIANVEEDEDESGNA